MPDFGYAGEILKIDLSDGKTTKLRTADYADKYLGGRGIAARLYLDMVPPHVKAFAPENHLIFMTGPVAGFPRFAGCRTQICGKSPQMNPEFFSYANLGGSWGAWLKYAAYDGIVVSGRAGTPVYLYLDDRRKVEIRDASHLWGKNTIETQNILHAELGNDARVFGIGPAGENQVYFAAALAAEHSLAGGGLISVMGSKKLKAIVVKVHERKSCSSAMSPPD